MASNDEHMIKNSLLFISVRENIPFVEKLVKVRKHLEQGADVNAQDGNDGGNTPLHMAVRRGEEALVDLLLNYGANSSRKNWNGLTPVDFAETLSSNKTRINIQQIEKRVSSDAIKEYVKRDKSQTYDEKQRYYTETSSNIAEPEVLKEAITSGVCCQLYMTKLLTLVYIRALNDELIEGFLLGTNYSDIDNNCCDICLRYRVKDQDRPFIMSVQVKHKEDSEKTNLGMEDYKAFKCLNMLKYFERYQVIKNRFQSNKWGAMYEGNFGDIECNLVFHAPAKNCFTKKNTEHQVSEKVKYLINTGDNIQVFQYDYDEDDIGKIAKMAVLEELKKLGTVLCSIISKAKFYFTTNIFKWDTLFVRYHVVIGGQILQPCKMQTSNMLYRMWEFKPEFFESNSEYLVEIKRTLIKELSKMRYDESEITNIDRKNVKLFLLNPCAATISKLIGKLAIYNENTKKLQLLDITALREIFETEYFVSLLNFFNDIKVDQTVITEAIQINLTRVKFKLPLSFGNIDMTFRGSDYAIQKRMKHIVAKLLILMNRNGDSMILHINEDDLGPGKIMERGIIDMNGGIGSAVGNLLILDEDTKMLKFDLDNKNLPKNAALFLNVLRNAGRNLYSEKLSLYRISVNVDNFPKLSFKEDKNNISLANSFLTKLWFYSSQTTQDEVERTIKNEIDKYYNKEKSDQLKFKIHCDAIFWSFYDLIQKWWVRSIKKDMFAISYLNQSSIFNLESKNELYETKLMCLIYIRGLKDREIEKLYFGNSIRGIGDMDDLCLRYRVQCQQRPAALFLQAKKNENYKTFEDAAESELYTCFSCLTFFESYLRIQDRFRVDNKDPMYEGDFEDVDCNFILYTQATDTFTKKKMGSQVKKMHYLINTTINKNMDVFQIDYIDRDVNSMVELLVKKRVRNWGKTFLSFLNNKTHEDILADKLIATYHVIIAREVFEQQEVHENCRIWKFRQDFFNSNVKVTECNQHLVTLKKMFIEEMFFLQKRWRWNQLNKPSSSRVSKMDSYPDHLVLPDVGSLNLATFKLPLAFGNLDMTFCGSKDIVKKRMEEVADKLIKLLELNKDMKVVEINNNDVGPGKIIEQRIMDINGGISSAVGNLFVWDPDRKMLKFNLDIGKLPKNAGLFLRELKNDKYIPINEDLQNYRFRINVNGFPKDSFDDNEYYKIQARTFFSKLWFYTNQAKENELERIIKDEINGLLLRPSRITSRLANSLFWGLDNSNACVEESKTQQKCAMYDPQK